jgi:CBS domain-containing protein
MAVVLRHTEPESAPVTAVMSRPPVTVPAGSSLDAVEHLFLARGISRAPVVDLDGRLLGIVAKTDLITEHVEGRVEHRTVDDVMSRQVVTVGDHASLSTAAQLMADRRLHGLPVVAAGGKVVGMLSSLDVVRWLARR